MKIGISFLSKDNRPTAFDDILVIEFSHISIYFKLDLSGKKS